MLIALVGCHRASLMADDSLMLAGAPSMLTARVEHAGHGGRVGQVGVPVRYYAGDRLLGEARTDTMGAATLTVSLPAEVTRYTTRTEVDGETLESAGDVHTWPRERTTIVCDIDETVSLTNYNTLVWGKGEDMGSVPLPDAAATLTRLSQRFGLLYLTARPSTLLDKTRRWIEQHGFPRAPIITAPNLADSLAVQRFKAQTIREYQARFPTIGIGIGNANTDSEAYAQRGLLTLIIDDHDDARFRAHAVVLRDWRSVGAFFEANRAMLEDPARLKSAIETGDMIRRPIVPYQRRGRQATDRRDDPSRAEPKPKHSNRS